MKYNETEPVVREGLVFFSSLGSVILTVLTMTRAKYEKYKQESEPEMGQYKQ